ncbi:Rad52/Rad22 family DNA repair protein [Acidicapsa dinghuensis]|uniref:Rad52/Rad22 family DNA repair protein n=1 Tax=Acidicapsa dinghuensis TaxID=2218256 RepID=A0ABW1EFN0_9BACT|nr:Rad52/Rad22 family DNA repair protein [Acidicapsa dinghuensis]
MKGKERRLAADQRAKLIENLCDPFPVSLIRWLVVDKAANGAKGKLFAYADARAYTDRLNDVVGAASWSENYSVSTLDGLSRVRNGETARSGKVFAACTLWIDGLGTRSGTGERWADDPNAMMEADAQALKRACSRFGLGRYLYDLGPCWVPLDRDGQPTVVPELPQWAWPRRDRVSGAPELKVVPISTSSPALLNMGTTRKIESFRSTLGDAIYAEILINEGQCDVARGIRTRLRQLQVLRKMQTAAGLVRRVGALTRRLGTGQLMAEMEDLNIRTVAEIPSLEVLAQLVQHLGTIAARRIA